MKKYLLSFAVLLMGAASFTSCSDDDDAPELKPVSVSNGVFVIGSGNQKGSISGSMTYYNYDSKEATLSAFAAVNGRSLGLTSNDMVVYGTKAYIAVDGENTIEVIDRTTLKSLKQIKTTDLLGKDNGLTPRHLTTYDGKVYFTTYGAKNSNGYVASIDTIAYAMKDSFMVGSKPEGLGVSKDILYVANSDYGYGNASISKIDLKNKKVSTLKNDLIMNPLGVIVIDDVVYILDSGKYDASWNQTDAGVRKLDGDKVVKLFDATGFGAANGKIYSYNNPYGSTTVTFAVYDTKTQKSSALNLSDVFSPAAINVDPINGNIYVASVSKGETGYADYKAKGYVNEYKADGTFVSKFTCGVGPVAIVFNTGVEYK